MLFSTDELQSLIIKAFRPRRAPKIYTGKTNAKILNKGIDSFIFCPPRKLTKRLEPNCTTNIKTRDMIMESFIIFFKNKYVKTGIIASVNNIPKT